MDESNGPWLLILDNADDANMFSYATPGLSYHHEVNLSAYIPQTVTGSVLVTSRNKDAAYRLVGDYKTIITISSMDLSEALSLLNQKLTDKHPIVECQELLVALDCIPLAITQAAAYISKGAPRMNVSRYLDLFNKSESNRSNLLDEDAGDLRRDPDVPNAVITTWQISFNQIRRDNPSAADLLSLMSVLNRQGILEHLLHQDNDNGLLFETAVALLLGFSLIVVESGGDSYEIHRLVQLATRKWLEVHGEIMRWNQKALQLLSEVFPDGDYQNWKLCGPLLPHIEMVLSCSFQSQNELLQKASVLHNLSWYLWAKGDYQLSKSKAEQALEIRKHYLDKENIDLLATFGLYGTVLSANGQYDEAEAMHRQALQLREEVLGQKHPGTLTSMNNLALVLDRQGKYDEAEAMHRQSLQLSKEVFGQKHPHTLTSMSNLALVLNSQGKYDEAEAMHRQTLQLREEVLGQKHPDTLTSMNNLALVLDSQGKYDEAEAMHRQELQLSEEVLGQKHPGTLTSMYCLAYLLQNRKDYDDSSALYQKALSGFEEVLGINHPTTLACSEHYSLMLEESERAKREAQVLRDSE